MSNQLSIQASLPILGSDAVTEPPRRTAPASTAVPAPAPAGKPAPLFTNPNFRFDQAAGMVVIEFHDDTGKVVSSIPSQTQLAAYRSHQASPPGDGPPQPTKLPQAGDHTISDV